MIGIIKTLMLKELVGYGSTDKAVYPVTSTGAVFDNNSVSLDSIIADLYAKIKNNSGGGGGGDNPDNPDNPGGGGGTKGEKGDKGDPGETYNYVPCFIYIHPNDNAVPKKPVGGSYDFTTNTLTPPSGWSISYSGMNKPIYMSIGMACSKPGSTIEWSAPFIAFSDAAGGSDLPYVPVPESNYKTLFIYKHSDTQPDIPVGGSYDFSTQRLVLPDGGWQTTKDILEKPVYMSIGFCSKSKTDIEWSYPVIVADGEGLGPGKTPGSDILTKTYVVAAYTTSNGRPTRPASNDGNVDFTTNPYTITPPEGWSLDRSIAVNDNAWCIIKVFHQTSKNDYNNNSTPWSEPVQANLANVTLTDDQFQLIANQVKVDATDITTNFDKWIMQGSNIEMIAKKIVATTDIYSVVAGQYIVNADFIENVANKVISVANFKQDVIMDTSGKIVAQITADKDGLYSAIANNIVQEAIQDKDNQGGIIYLVAKDVTNNITAEILTGTDENGKGFIKAIANSIDFNSDSFKSIVANAAEGKVTAIMQDDNTIALINKAASDTASSLIVGDQFINLIAPKVDVSGKLSSKDLTINGGKSKFNADGSGYIAGGNITWSTDGSGSLAGGHITWDKNGNATYSGGLEATTGTIAGFKISGDGITNAGFDNDAYIIIRNDNEKSFTGIGANVMPASTGGLRCNARFENDKVDNDITAFHNLAMYLHASGSAKGNWALYGVGNAGLEGAFMGYGSNEFTPSGKNNTISLKDGNQVLISVSNDYTNVHLPLHTVVAENLFINNNTKFSLRLTIINTSDSKIIVYGYKGTTNATNDVPHLWDGNTEVGSISLETHQTLEVMLVYNGTSYCAYALGGKY